MSKFRIKNFISEYILCIALFFIATFAISYSRYLYAPSDDAYIFLVYAKNFLQGNGLTFNGMVVEGFSSPLWVALLIVFGISQIDLPILMQILSTLSGAFAIIATYYLSTILLKERTTHYKSWSLLPIALLASTGDFAFYLSSGLEQVLFTGLIALSTAVYQNNREKALQSLKLPILFALTILTRPEGVLFAVLIYLHGVIETKSLLPSFKSGLKLTAILAPIMLLKRLYYGYWLPNTYYIKSGTGFSNIQHGKIYLLQNKDRYLIIVVLFAILLLVSLFPKYRKSLNNVNWMIAFSLVWGIYTFINGGDNLVGGRMLIPILPLVYTIITYMAQNIRLPLTASSIAIIPIITLLMYGYAQDRFVQAHISRWRNNYPHRVNAGLYLKENYSPDTLVALNPAGIIPYYSELPTIDMLGLNNPEIAHNGKRDYTLPFGHQAGDGAYVLLEQPDIIFFGGTAAKIPSSFISDQEIGHSDDFKKHYIQKAWQGIGYAHIRNTAP